MNLMFRKNFREGGSNKPSSGGGLKNKNANRYQAKRSREIGDNSEDYHFRTHIFFAATNRPGYQDKMEGYTNNKYVDCRVLRAFSSILLFLLCQLNYFLSLFALLQANVCLLFIFI